MPANYDLNKLKKALTDFYRAAGIKISLLDVEFKCISSADGLHNPICDLIHRCVEGCSRCEASDRAILAECQKSRKFALHTCHAGLIDLAVPLIDNNRVIGYIILGQIRSGNDFNTVFEKISDLDIDYALAEKTFYNLPLFDADRIESIVNIAVMLTKYILFEEMIRFQYNRNLDAVIRFIAENLNGNLSVDRICESTNVSKSTLYEMFHAHMRCTVSEYIVSKRIEKAKACLKSSALTVEQISQCVGFSDCSYFCRLFKKRTGQTPLQYRSSCTKPGTEPGTEKNP